MQPLTAYIQQPALLDQDAVEQLAALVERFPYFQSARMMLVCGLYQLQDDRFGAELRKAAICVPDRAQLFQLIEAPAMQPKGAAQRTLTTDTTDHPQSTDRTLSLIDSFLTEQPEQQRSRRTGPVDASVDYMAYLMQQEDATPLPPPAPRPVEPEPAPAADAASDTAAVAADSPNGDEDAYLTETLARIYIKQGKYIKAIEIIRRLSLRNPKKNRYFADQIRFLQKLIANNQVLETENSNNK